MKEIRDLTRDESSLLIFFETLAVDQRGVVTEPLGRMNEADYVIAKRWNKEGFIEFKRYSYDGLHSRKVLTHRIRMTDEAINLAHQLRKERIRRNESTI